MVLFRASNWKICKAPPNSNTRSSAGRHPPWHLTTFLVRNYTAHLLGTTGHCLRGFQPHISLLGLRGCSLSIEPEACEKEGERRRKHLPCPLEQTEACQHLHSLQGQIRCTGFKLRSHKSASNTPRGVIRSDDNTTVNGLPNTSFHVMLN